MASSGTPQRTINEATSSTVQASDPRWWRRCAKSLRTERHDTKSTIGSANMALQAPVRPAQVVIIYASLNIIHRDDLLQLTYPPKKVPEIVVLRRPHPHQDDMRARGVNRWRTHNKYQKNGDHFFSGELCFSTGTLLSPPVRRREG